MAKITGTKKVDEELGDEGFEMGQRVWLPSFKQAGTITGMTDITIEGESFEFHYPGVYRFLGITLDDGMEIRKPRSEIETHIPVEITEWISLDDLTWWD